MSSRRAKLLEWSRIFIANLKNLKETLGYCCELTDNAAGWSSSMLNKGINLFSLRIFQVLYVGNKLRRLIVIMKGKGVERVLVTGGAGFIGSHTADFLVKQGYDVKCFY